MPWTGVSRSSSVLQRVCERYRRHALSVRNAGMDVNALLPVLTTAMGHVKYHDTQIYLHIDAAVLRTASTTFESHTATCRDTAK